MNNIKPVEFLGSSLDSIRTFPASARHEAGYQIERVQKGEEPNDWKPMNAIGQGVREIRIRDQAGAFRVVYVVKFTDAVYILHCFQKKTAKTNKKDVELARNRYRTLMQELMP